MSSEQELREKIEGLRFNRLTVAEYDSLAESGHIIRKAPIVDDRAFEKAYPKHPMNVLSRKTRISAADYFLKRAEEAPLDFDLNLIQELHDASADCCAAVRFAIVRALGVLRNPISIPILQAVISREVDDSSTKEAATQAIAIIEGEWSTLFDADPNHFELWMRRRSRLESPNELRTHFQALDRERKAFASYTLAGHKVLVEPDGAQGISAVEKESGRLVTLTDGEGTQLLRAKKSGIGRALQMAGIPIQPDSIEIRFQNVNLLDEFPNCVLLDSTTLRNAALCLDGYVSPLNLLDLSVFCTAVICYDRVVVQPIHSQIAAEFPAVFSPLTYSPTAIPGTLWTVCANIFNSHDRSSPATIELENAWKVTLQRDDIVLDIQSTDHFQDSPAVWDGVPASHFAGRLFSGDDIAVDSMNAFLSVQTVRALFDDVLAGLMGIPYLSTAIRAPVLGVIMQRKVQLKPIVDALIDSLAAPQAEPGSKQPFAAELAAPFFLGLVLEKSKRRGDVVDTIMEFRNSAAPLRRQLDKDREAWSGRGHQYLNRVIQSMSGFVASDVSVAKTAVNTTMTALAPLVTATQPHAQMASAGVKLALLLAPLDKVKLLYNRIFRPQLYWLRELSDEAKAVRDLDVQIQRVFGSSWTKDMRSQLELLAATYPAAFAKLRSPTT